MKYIKVESCGECPLFPDRCAGITKPEKGDEITQSCPLPDYNRPGNMREELAELCHEQWSGWMKYLFSKCLREKGRIAIPDWAVDRWMRQMKTPYTELCATEKESDRNEADKFIKLLSTREGDE